MPKPTFVGHFFGGYGLSRKGIPFLGRCFGRLENQPFCRRRLVIWRKACSTVRIAGTKRSSLPISVSVGIHYLRAGLCQLLFKFIHKAAKDIANGAAYE